MRKNLSLVALLVACELGIWGLARWGYFDGNKVLGETTNTLESRVLSLERRVYQLEKTAGLIKTKTASAPKETSIALNGGSAENYDWIKIPGSDFTFDLSLYGGSAAVSWEGWMDTGMGYARIYDDTNYRAVDGSEVMVVSGTKSSFYSKSMSIWRGQNTYHLEVKSLSGAVTISSPRLKVLVK